MVAGVKAAAVIAVSIGLAACSNPTYVDASKTKDASSPDLLTNQVVFQVHKGFDDPAPDCVAVMPLKAGSGISAQEAEAVRSAIFAHLAPRVREIPLADVDRMKGDPSAMHCAAIIEGDVTNYDTHFLGVFSHAGVGANLRMRRTADRTLVWEGSHIASSVGGGLPIDPLSAISSMVGAVSNVQGDQPARLTDDLARRLVSTIPAMVPPSTLDAVAPGTVQRSPTAIVAANESFEAGRASMAASDYPAARNAFQRAADLDPSNPRYQDSLGVARAAGGDPKGALAAYRKAVGLDAHDGFAWYNIGIIEFDAGHVDASIDAFRQSGSSYLAKDDKDRADQAAERLREIVVTYQRGDHT